MFMIFFFIACIIMRATCWISNVKQILNSKKKMAFVFCSSLLFILMKLIYISDSIISELFQYFMVRVVESFCTSENSIKLGGKNNMQNMAHLDLIIWCSIHRYVSHSESREINNKNKNRENWFKKRRNKKKVVVMKHF